MTPTPEWVIQALSNTQRPRNQAPIIYQAIRNDKPAGAGSSSPVTGHHNEGGRYGYLKL